MNILNIKHEIELLIYDSNLVESDEEREKIYEQIGALEHKYLDKVNVLADLYFESETFIAQQKTLIKERQYMLEKSERILEFLLNGDSLETAQHSFKFRKSTAVIVNSPELLPESFRRIVPESWNPDKTAIGKSLKAGEEVPGAILEERNNLQIR